MGFLSPSSPPATDPPKSFITNLAPSFEARRAVSLPIPLAAPVTKTTFPSKTPIEKPHKIKKLIKYG